MNIRLIRIFFCAFFIGAAFLTTAHAFEQNLADAPTKTILATWQYAETNFSLVWIHHCSLYKTEDNHLFFVDKYADNLVKQTTINIKDITELKTGHDGILGFVVRVNTAKERISEKNSGNNGQSFDDPIYDDTVVFQFGMNDNCKEQQTQVVKNLELLTGKTTGKYESNGRIF